MYTGPVKFNGIPREGKSAITTNSYKDQCREHMIRNGMWNVFYITYSQNKDKEWDLLLHHSKSPLEYVKGLVQSLLKGSEADQYIVQHLTMSGFEQYTDPPQSLSEDSVHGLSHITS